MTGINNPQYDITILDGISLTPFVMGCRSEWTCPECGTKYSIDGKPGTEVDGVVYVHGPCLCGMCKCDKCGYDGSIKYPDNPIIESVWLDGARYWDKAKADEIKIDQAKTLLHNWLNKQGHDRCWYYPEIFKELCSLFNVTMTVEPKLPPRSEFEKGCCKYQDEQYLNE